MSGRTKGKKAVAVFAKRASSSIPREAFSGRASERVKVGNEEERESESARGINGVEWKYTRRPALLASSQDGKTTGFFPSVFIHSPVPETTTLCRVASSSLPPLTPRSITLSFLVNDVSFSHGASSPDSPQPLSFLRASLCGHGDLFGQEAAALLPPDDLSGGGGLRRISALQQRSGQRSRSHQTSFPRGTGALLSGKPNRFAQKEMFDSNQSSEVFLVALQLFHPSLDRLARFHFLPHLPASLPQPNAKPVARLADAPQPPARPRPAAPATLPLPQPREPNPGTAVRLRDGQLRPQQPKQ